MFFDRLVESWSPGWLQGEDAGFGANGFWVAGDVFDDRTAVASGRSSARASVTYAATHSATAAANAASAGTVTTTTTRTCAVDARQVGAGAATFTSLRNGIASGRSSVRGAATTTTARTCAVDARQVGTGAATFTSLRNGIASGRSSVRGAEIYASVHGAMAAGRVGGRAVTSHSASSLSLGDAALIADLVWSHIASVRLEEIYRIHGLDKDNPLVVSQTQRVSGSIVQNISEAGSTTTVERL